jgi:uncharacterized membrane protein
MSWYRSKVERDLARWQSAGWVSEDGASAIRAEIAARKPVLSAAGVLAVLGAVLFGFAVVSFVAANWDEMSKLARLLLLMGALWGCYAGAGWLFVRGLPAFAHAAVLAGVAVFGASIMLVAQMYHMDGSSPAAVLLWALGALLAAGLVRSTPALAAAFVLLAVWSGWERGLSGTAHGVFLLPWATAAAVAAWLRWRPGLHLAALSLAAWIVPLGYLIRDRHGHWLVAAVGIAAALVAVAAAPQIDRHIRASRPVFAYAVAVAFAGLFIMQFLDDLVDPRTVELTLGRFIALAAVTLALLVAAMFWALHTDNRGALWIAYIAFAVEIFAIYVRMLGTLLNTSLFFLVAALIVSALAWAAYRLHQHQMAVASGARGAAA